jgi:hypothetical protein
MHVAQGCAFFSGYQLPAQIIGGGHHAGGQVLLVILVDVENGLPALGLLDAVAVYL